MRHPGRQRRWCSAVCAGRVRRHGTGIQTKVMCEWCSASFLPKRSDQRYCTSQCGVLHRSAKRSASRVRVVCKPRECPECGTIFTPRPNNAAKAVWCSQRCAQRDVNRRRRARQAGTQIEPIRPIEIYERDGWACQLCGGPIELAERAPHPRSRSIDHRVPLSRGGPHTRDNVQAAHFACNQLKSDFEEQTWQARVGPLSPSDRGEMTQLAVKLR